MRHPGPEQPTRCRRRGRRRRTRHPPVRCQRVSCWKVGRSRRRTRSALPWRHRKQTGEVPRQERGGLAISAGAWWAFLVRDTRNRSIPSTSRYARVYRSPALNEQPQWNDAKISVPSLMPCSSTRAAHSSSSGVVHRSGMDSDGVLHIEMIGHSVSPDRGVCRWWSRIALEPAAHLDRRL